MADTYRHGIYTEEVPTSLVPMVSVAAPTVAVGVAPQGKKNTPVLCHTLAEFKEEFGWSDDFETNTLCEVAYVHFQLYNVAPVVFINAYDTTATRYKKVTYSVNPTTPVKDNGDINTMGTVPDDLTDAAAVTGATFIVGTDERNELTPTTDYTVAISGTGASRTLTVTLTTAGKTKVNGWVSAAGSMPMFSLELIYSLTSSDSGCTATDIIGGYDEVTGKNYGLECVEEVYPRFGLIPGTLIAPKFSTQSSVAAVLKAKCTNINGVFQAIAIADIDTAQATTYTGVNSLKNSLNYVSPYLVVTYPKVSLGGKQTYLSTNLAALLGVVDAAHSDIPYKSPSNENLQCDQTVLANGTELFLGKAQANYLNGIGVVTALNFVGGWKCWGNRTSAYPSNTDPKDAFIPVRRMMNWVANTLITSYWAKIDEPINKRLVESVVDSAQIWINGLVARGALVGGRVEFREDENPNTDLADGVIRFHVYICPPTPAREINFIQEMDVSYFSSLFE